MDSIEFYFISLYKGCHQLSKRGRLKALVWFWLIDETLSANLVYQSDYEIGSTTLKWWSNGEDHDDGDGMVMIKCLNLEKKKEKNKKETSKLSNTYTNKVDKKASTPYLLKKKKNDKVVAIKVNKQANNGVKRFWVPKEIISNKKSTKKVWIPKGKSDVQWILGNLETWQSMCAFHGVHHIGSCQLPSGLVNTMDPNSPSHVR